MTKALICAAAVAAAVAAGAARADTMNPTLGAKLAGMGEHGIVNLRSMSENGKLCWTFTLAAKGLTGASIRDTAGMLVTRLGPTYSGKGCTKVSMVALER